MKKKCLVFDIETSAVDEDGVKINLRTDFDRYVEKAIVKWVGAYSYKHGRYYDYNALEEREDIIELFKEHKTLVSFNGENFDTSIMVNNGLIKNRYVQQLDMFKILGSNKQQEHKLRSEYMGVNLEDVWIDGQLYGANTLMSMAYHHGLETLKGDIDYNIFYKEEWSDEETTDIKKYLKSDVMITKQLFEKTFHFWTIFTPWLYESDVKKWVWMRNSIASLTYCAACKVRNKTPTFGGDKDEVEDMGGRAIEPLQEETWGVDYLDEASKYPHTFSEFNLFSEVDVNGKNPVAIQKAIDEGKLFHGNKKFKVKGYYDVRNQGVLEKDLINKLKTRFAIKKVLKQYKKGVKKLEIVPEQLKNSIPDGVLSEDVITELNGQQYAIKIFANSLYGAVRSPIFEQINSPNAGYDCCWLGQQIHEYVQRYFEERGFTIIGGFTDSWFFKSRQGFSKDDVLKIASDCMDELKKFMPFPADTHIIDYETFVDYILYHYDDKKSGYKKNNYAYISEGKVKVVGFPIMKDNATLLGWHIFKKYLEPEGLQKNRLKFKKSYVESLIKKELERDISLISVRMKCNPASSYKKDSQLQAQVSREYLDGLDGNIYLIKNKRYGRVGKGSKYCTVDEAKKVGLSINDLVLDKVWNEMAPFLSEEKTASLNDW